METKTPTGNNTSPDIAIPPVEYLAEEMGARGFSQKSLAKRMRRLGSTINEIIHRKEAVSVETALPLEEVMPEIPARFWRNLETDYQLTKIVISRRTKAG